MLSTVLSLLGKKRAVGQDIAGTGGLAFLLATLVVQSREKLLAWCSPLLTVSLLSFMAGTGGHSGAAEDFADVALVHHAGAELLLEDDLLQLLLLGDVGVALSAGPKRRSCCWS
jgi:hypothetical protein